MSEDERRHTIPEFEPKFEISPREEDDDPSYEAYEISSEGCRLYGYFESDEHGQRIHVTDITVDSQFQGNNLGTRLLREAVRAAKNRDIERLTADATSIGGLSTLRRIFGEKGMKLWFLRYVDGQEASKSVDYNKAASILHSSSVHNENGPQEI